MSSFKGSFKSTPGVYFEVKVTNKQVSLFRTYCYSEGLTCHGPNGMGHISGFVPGAQAEKMLQWLVDNKIENRGDIPRFRVPTSTPVSRAGAIDLSEAQSRILCAVIRNGECSRHERSDLEVLRGHHLIIWTPGSLSEIGVHPTPWGRWFAVHKGLVDKEYPAR